MEYLRPHLSGRDSMMSNFSTNNDFFDQFESYPTMGESHDQTNSTLCILDEFNFPPSDDFDFTMVVPQVPNGHCNITSESPCLSIFTANVHAQSRFDENFMPDLHQPSGWPAYEDNFQHNMLPIYALELINVYDYQLNTYSGEHRPRQSKTTRESSFGTIQPEDNFVFCTPDKVPKATSKRVRQACEYCHKLKRCCTNGCGLDNPCSQCEKKGIKCMPRKSLTKRKSKVRGG